MRKARHDDDAAKWRQLVFLAVIVWLAMTLWFSASAVTGSLKQAWNLTPTQEAWLTISVQLGFAVGALGSAALNLPDRWSLPRLIALASLGGAAVNGAIPWGISDEAGRTSGGFWTVVLLRMATGVMLAGIYPPGMKLLATWFVRRRGLAIGVLVGALSVGSSSPHLLRAFVPPDAWRSVMYLSSMCAVAAAVLSATLARTGPHLPNAAAFDWTYCARVWRDVAVRRANFGYLGHMFELYAMWTWTPALIAASFRDAELSAGAAPAVAFVTVAAGGAGCVLAGLWADQIGRTWTTIASLAASGSCALVAGMLYGHPVLLSVVCIVWGFAVVADSAQFSTAVSELCHPNYVGTALTIQTCAGFLLTTLTIYAVPAVQAASGSWVLAMAMLSAGPLFGMYHMYLLRQMDEAEKMAGGMR
jgi:MFS family permease